MMKKTSQSPIQSTVTYAPNLLILARQIRNHILCDVEDARLRELGASIIRRFHVPSREPRQLARAFQLFSQQRVKFFREYPEVNAAPWITARWGIGDCDDKARLVAALCKSFRIPVRLMYLTFNTGKRTVSHVWPEVLLGHKWCALESVRPWPIGKSALQTVIAKKWPYKIFSMDI